MKKIFIVNLTVCSNRQINGEDFIKFCGLLTKHELYPPPLYFQTLPPALSQELGTFMLGDIFSIQADLLHVKLMMSFNEKNIIMVYEIIKHRF